VSGQPVCPECATPVQLDWEWCHSCGFDPEGNRPPELSAPRRSDEAQVPLLSRASAPSRAAEGGSEPGAGLPPSYEQRAATSTTDPPPSFDPSSFAATSFDTTAFDTTAFDTTSPDTTTALPTFDALPVSDWPTPPAPSAPPPPPPAPRPGTAPPPPGPGGRSVRDRLGGSSAIGGPGGARIPGTPQKRSLPTISFDSRVIKVAAISVAVILALGAMTMVLVRTGGDERGTTATTLDPKAPPPIGQLQLGSRTTTTLAAALPAGWSAYRSPDGTFAAVFPGIPKARGSQSTISGITLNGLEVVLDPTGDAPVWGVSYFDTPSASTFADSQDAFEQIQKHARNATASGPFTVESAGADGILFNETLGGRPARGILLSKGKRVYVLEAVDASDADFDTFLRGFRWHAEPAT
jgi:hypothetical protein